MDPIEMWGIFFLSSVACATGAAAMPIEAWGIFFLSSVAVIKGGRVDRAQHLVDISKYPEVKGFFRIEAWPLHLENDQVVEHNGISCDEPLGICGPELRIFIDKERQNHDFGADSTSHRNYTALLTAEDLNSPVVNKTISRNVCGKSVRSVDVRVRAEDVNTMRYDDKIDNFSCFIFGPDIPAANEAESKWSTELSCDGQDRKSTKIWFRYRWFFIDPKICRSSFNDRGMLVGSLS
ncbi:hypothetical protein RvY_00329-1 [Ramazzottius varieornatus]|uniref:Uncharacterized protein n=1 Tax=Ramazzottius varieornatus TaxID=947166 RepID=A0A1D1UGI3_RAMVA|nr:hypothetical protein RvY_00329-1 [Ramazzottius varieornatus]